MSQPRWMQGKLIEEDKQQPRWMQGEVISEGGFNEPYGNTEMQSFGIGQAPVPTDPAQLSALKEDARVHSMTDAERFIAGIDRASPEEIQAQNNQKTGRMMSAGIGYGDGVLGGQWAEIEGRDAAYPAFSGVPGTSHLAHFVDQADLLPESVGGGRGDLAEIFEGGFEDIQAKAQRDNPLTYMGSQLAGYIQGAGGFGWSGGANLARKVPGAQQLANVIGQTGRLPSWLVRIVGSGAAVTADAAAFGATVGASDLEAQTGKQASLQSRGEIAKDYAFANLGDAGDNLGVEVPKWARAIPINAVVPLVGSIGERSLKGISSGGRTITPDRVQAATMQNIGRLPSADSTARGMAEVIDLDNITGSTIKTFRFIENALTDAGKSAGLPAPAVRQRIMRGFESIRQSLPTLSDGRTTLAEIIEREFAQDFGPRVTENFRKFLLKVGMDDPGVTRGFIDRMRETQVDDFRNVIDDNLGRQSATDFENAVEAGINKKVSARQDVLNHAKENANFGPLADSMREHLIASDHKSLLAGEASRQGFKNVDVYINQDPWNAGNLLQSELGRIEDKAFNSGNAASYGNLKASKEWIQDMLGRSDTTGLPGYNRLTGQIAAEARVRENLGYVDGFGKKHEGFGPDLKKAARSERETLRMKERYEGNTPQDRAAVARLPNKAARDLALERAQAASRVSSGEVLKDQLRGARPGGTNAQGQDVVGLRLSDLQTQGMMSTDPSMPGALPTVFGEAGERISRFTNDLVDRRQFLTDIDPNTGSNTANKLNAMATGDDAFTPGLTRSMPESSLGKEALLDVLMFANGIPPVATLAQKMPGWMQAPFRPSQARKAELANTLLNLPQPRVAPPTAPPPVPKLTGHSNPQWRNDPRWNDPNFTGNQSPPPGGPSAKNGFFPEGNTFPMIAAGYGAANPQDVPGTSEGITWEDRVAYAALLGGGAKALGKIDNLRPPPGGPPAASNGILGNQRGAINIGGGPQRRKDLLKEAMSKSQGAPVEGVPRPSHQAKNLPQLPPPAPKTSRGIPGGPLPMLGALGVGSSIAYGIGKLNQPEASSPTAPPAGGPNAMITSLMNSANRITAEDAQRAAQGMPPTHMRPGLKPRLDDTIESVTQTANEAANSEERQRQQEYWEHLQRYGNPGDTVKWNKIREKRARDLLVMPEDRARGVRAKRLPYGYEVPIDSLKEAPIEELVNGEWRVAEPAR